MKKGLKVLISLVCLFVIGLPVFAQPSSKSVETTILDNFDHVGEQNYFYPNNGQTYNWTWNVQASRFVAEGFPKQLYLEAIPNSLKQLRSSNEDKPLVYGIQTAFNRKGDNWFEVFPEADGKPAEIPFVGIVDKIDFWVWGSNYMYYLEVLIRDANGRVHVLDAGNLKFSGWKNIIVSIPGWLVQHSSLRSGPETASFVGFRIRTDAEEKVDDFIIYFDQLKYYSNPLSLIYDGFELRNIDFESGKPASEVKE